MTNMSPKSCSDMTRKSTNLTRKPRKTDTSDESVPPLICHKRSGTAYVHINGERRYHVAPCALQITRHHVIPLKGIQKETLSWSRIAFRRLYAYVGMMVWMFYVPSPVPYRGAITAQ